MNHASRIKSILSAHALDMSVTGFPKFQLSDLDLPTNLNFSLPTNLRLGHLAEKAVSVCIQASSNYKLLFENIQLKEDKQTVGELDFILQNQKTQELIHLELAYKFYLYDPDISEDALYNWIGPNRNDALHSKLEKLKTKQFPLLYHSAAAETLEDLDIKTASQKLCLLASLFIPHRYKGHFNPSFAKAIQGFYINFETFQKLDGPSETYYIPTKKEWGMAPTIQEKWVNFAGVEKQIHESLNEQQAVLYWENDNGIFSTNFIVWW